MCPLNNIMTTAFEWSVSTLLIPIIGNIAKQPLKYKAKFQSRNIIFICDCVKRGGRRVPSERCCSRVAIVILNNISEARILVAEIPLIAISPNVKRKLLDEWMSADRNGADSVLITVSLVQPGSSVELSARRAPMLNAECPVLSHVADSPDCFTVLDS